jgi:hypothetical protein
MKTIKVAGWIPVVALLAAAGGCGSSAGTGTGGSGGGTSSSTGTTTTTTTTTSGTGGSSGGCLDATAFASLFTIEDAAFCAVAMYEADEALGAFQEPSWGSHDGPLTQVADASGGGVTLERWTAPAGPTGMLTKQSVHVAAVVSSGAFLNAQAIDLPFFGWTAISWTGPGTAGQIATLTGGVVDDTYTANGVYALAGFAAGASQGRLLYTGLSPLGAATMAPNGLYAADACSMPKQELGAGQGCAPPTLVDAWGENSGPVAFDKAGNAFAVQVSTTAGTQEARGYATAQVAVGAPPVTGTTLFTVPGFSGSLAAITPTASDPGVLVFQSFDATTDDALDVVAQRYTANGTVTATTMPSTLLKVPAMMMSGYPFMTDGADRLWVAVPGATTTTYVVIARAPM